MEHLDHRPQGDYGSRSRSSEIRGKDTEKLSGLFHHRLDPVDRDGLALLLYSSRKPEHASLAVYALW